MATVELEVWADGDDDDHARLLTKLQDEEALSLYGDLCDSAYMWCEERGATPEVYRRTTGRHVQIADVLRWYMEEGALREIQVDGEVAFVPVPEVRDALQRPAPMSSIVPIDE